MPYIDPKTEKYNVIILNNRIRKYIVYFVLVFNKL